MNRLSSIDSDEIERFAKDSEHWWDEKGPFKPLHKINPARLSFIKQQICDHYGRGDGILTFENLEILDIGCGGGLICEPLARLGAVVTGLDADSGAIKTAKEHARTENLKITYLNEDLKNIDKQFDVVLALEILEHVSDVSLFIEQAAKVLSPHGLMVVSTVNRTAKSFALGIVAAEYILRWVPKGTHSWKNFIKPSELARHARKCNLQPVKINGIVYSPKKDGFYLSESSTDINYSMSFKSKS